MGEHSGPIFLGSVRGDLITDGWSRVAEAVSPQRVAEWRRAAEAGETCPLRSIESVLLKLGPLPDIGWWDEANGLPEGPAFILDLIDRPSAEGGLLLHAAGEDRVRGWRPQAGSMTAYHRGALVLSPTVPGSQRRPAVWGRLSN